MPARLSARTDEEWLQGDEVALAKPVRDAAGEADRRLVRLDQLGRKRIHRVAVAAASAFHCEEIVFAASPKIRRSAARPASSIAAAARIMLG
jgi:hypothetical protein